MKKLGSKMFKGGALGATLGAGAGALYGNKVANQEIALEPYDSVEISGGKLPKFEFNENWDGSVSWKVTPGEMPEVKGVKSNEAEIRAENILGYAVIGAIAGGAGGALTAAALEAFNDED